MSSLDHVLVHFFHSPPHNKVSFSVLQSSAITELYFLKGNCITFSGLAFAFIWICKEIGAHSLERGYFIWFFVYISSLIFLEKNCYICLGFSGLKRVFSQTVNHSFQFMKAEFNSKNLWQCVYSWSIEEKSNKLLGQIRL